MQRLGNGSFDDFYTGTFTSNGSRIGYLRYPAFDFFVDTELSKEVAYFQLNTDGLIIDVMGNPGRDTCTLENFIQYFMPSGFHSLGQQIRADWGIVVQYQQAVDGAIQQGGYTDDEIAQMRAVGRSVEGLCSEPRIHGPDAAVQPVAGRSHRDRPHRQERCVYQADHGAHRRVELFGGGGFRGHHAGQQAGDDLRHADRRRGRIAQRVSAGIYTEAAASIAQTRIVRQGPIKSPEYPAAPYIENIGVFPDHVFHYMTAADLLRKGKPFVMDFTQTMVGYINAQRPETAVSEPVSSVV